MRCWPAAACVVFCSGFVARASSDLPCTAVPGCMAMQRVVERLEEP